MVEALHQILPTPMASDGMTKGEGGGAGSTYPLRMILATPRKSDADRGGRGDVLSQLQGHASRHAGMMGTPTANAAPRGSVLRKLKGRMTSDQDDFDRTPTMSEVLHFDRPDIPHGMMPTPVKPNGGRRLSAGDRDGTAGERSEGADRHAEPAAPCSDHAADAGSQRIREQCERIGAADTFDAPYDPRDDNGNPADADEARQPHGQLESGLRPQEIADDGRGDGWGDEGSRAGQMGGSAVTGGDAAEPWADWNGGLAHHLRLDDGLSAWVADTRIALGSRKGTAAASLIVEAFGDAVLPQIPEAIGRAILRTEAALDAVLGPRPFAVSSNGDAP